MNVEIGTEAAQFPEKEYISGIFLAVQSVMLVFSTFLVKYCPSNLLTGSTAEGLVQREDYCAYDSYIIVLLNDLKITSHFSIYPFLSLSRCVGGCTLYY